MATIKLEKVKKIYDKQVVAVHDFNLEIADKEFVVFVGPSGCGKSTTLRMVAGLEDISEGTVSIDGRIVNDLPPKDRNIAMVFQNYALYPHLTVFENIAFPLRLLKQERLVPMNDKEKAKAEEQAKKFEDQRDAAQKEKEEIEAELAKLEEEKAAADEKGQAKVQKKIDEVKHLHKVKEEAVINFGARAQEIRYQIENGKIVYSKMKNDEIYKKVTEVSEILGITQYLARKPRALSGGQRQRVAIGRAMVRDSKVLLMDEPLSNLDAKLRNQMRAEIILLRKKIDSTFIYVTHDQTEAMTLGDRIVIMKDGFIQQVGTPQQVFDTPANLFVAGFIGAPQMNFFHEAKLDKDGKKYSVEIKGVKFPVDGANGEILAKADAKPGEVILGVRPEHMVFSVKPAKDALECELIVSEMMGSELHLHLQCVDGSQIIVRVPTVNLSEEEKKAATVPGSKAYISFEGKVMHLFDKETHTSLLHPEFEYIVHD